MPFSGGDAYEINKSKHSCAEDLRETNKVLQCRAMVGQGYGRSDLVLLELSRNNNSNGNI